AAAAAQPSAAAINGYPGNEDRVCRGDGVDPQRRSCRRTGPAGTGPQRLLVLLRGPVQVAVREQHGQEDAYTTLAQGLEQGTGVWFSPDRDVTADLPGTVDLRDRERDPAQRLTCRGSLGRPALPPQTGQTR